MVLDRQHRIGTASLVPRPVSPGHRGFREEVHRRRQPSGDGRLVIVRSRPFGEQSTASMAYEPVLAAHHGSGDRRSSRDRQPFAVGSDHRVGLLPRRERARPSSSITVYLGPDRNECRPSSGAYAVAEAACRGLEQRQPPGFWTTCSEDRGTAADLLAGRGRGLRLIDILEVSIAGVPERQCRRSDGSGTRHVAKAGRGTPRRWIGRQTAQIPRDRPASTEMRSCHCTDQYGEQSSRGLALEPKDGVRSVRCAGLQSRAVPTSRNVDCSVHGRRRQTTPGIRRWARSEYCRAAHHSVLS